jgi:hypothetical protein
VLGSVYSGNGFAAESSDTSSGAISITTPEIIRYSDIYAVANWTLAGDRLFFVGGAYAGHTIVEAPSEQASYPEQVYVSGTDASTSSLTSSTTLSCSITQNPDGTCPLTCTNALGGSSSFTCYPSAQWQVGASAAPGCQQFTPVVITN